MRKELKENGGLSKRLLWTMSIIAGISVANLYYNQPLLNMIKEELNISDLQSNMIAMVSQIGYAFGLLFVIPLGDMFQRRNIIISNFTVLIISLLTIYYAPNINILLTASFFVGMCSVIPQIFIPIAAIYSTPENKGKNIGMVVSGLLTGILASRIISGLIGEWLGWREMYLAAAIMMFVSVLVCIRIIPDIRPSFKGTYPQLLKSLFGLVKDYPLLRIYALRSGVAFGSFLAMWSCLAFKMSQEPFYAGSDIVGILGLCGIAGAISASFLGKFVERTGARKFNITGCILMSTAWILLYFGGNYYISIIAGIIIIDIGMQCIQLSNQTLMFKLCPSASNRMNTLFMTTYFIGGSIGTFLAGYGWEKAEWAGTAIVGVSLVILSMIITLAANEKN